MANDSKFTYQIIDSALSIPGVKVDRTEFLTEAFADVIAYKTMPLLLEKGPVESGILSTKALNTIAIKSCNKTKWQSSVTSFATGIPGGLALAATIPLDTLQFFSFSLRVAQQVAYIYGYDDFWRENDGIDNDRVQSELVMFLGTMLNTEGASSALRLLSTQLPRQMPISLPKNLQEDVVYYMVIEHIANDMARKIKDDSVSRGLAKFIPLLGGVVSGGLTYRAMSYMNKLLYEALDVAVTYTDSDLELDLQHLNSTMPEAFNKKLYCNP